MRTIGPALAVAAIIVCAAVLRARLAGAPLERDEGEYAYAGQLILHGFPPYTLAYNMKFPGVYYAYAGIMAILGQTPWGIHIGLLAVNAGSIALVCAIGRRLSGAFTGAVAAAAFAQLSIGPSVLGVFAHATHFAALPALGGFLLLLGPVATAGSFTPSPRRLLAAGALLGLAVLMKQHAIMLLLWGLIVGVWRSAAEGRTGFRSGSRGCTSGIAAEEDADPPRHSEDGVPRGGRVRGAALRPALRAAAWICAGALAPFLAMCALFLWQGVLGRFAFWTFGYAREYVSEVPLAAVRPIFTRAAGDLVATNGLLWCLAGAGAIVLWAAPRGRIERIFVTGLFAASFLSVCPGFYFRQHYFVLMLPAIALLAAVPVDALRRWLTDHGGPGAPVAGAAYLVVAALALAPQTGFLFHMTPVQASRATYGGNPFPEAVDIGRYLAHHTSPNDRIAVLGSEPEIYFYADRRSATGYIYTYPLMERQAYAGAMQQEMIRDIETSHPAFIVLVKTPTSWLIRPDSDRTILQWSDRYLSRCYQPAGIIEIVSASETRAVWTAEEARAYRPAGANVLVVLKRASEEPCVVADADKAAAGSGAAGSHPPAHASGGRAHAPPDEP